MAHLEGRRVVEFGDLPLDGLDDLRPAMAGIHAPQARRPVENATAVVGVVVHVLSAREKPRRLLELPVRRERHPERGEIVGDRTLQGHDIHHMVLQEVRIMAPRFIVVATLLPERTFAT